MKNYISFCINEEKTNRSMDIWNLTDFGVIPQFNTILRVDGDFKGDVRIKELIYEMNDEDSEFIVHSKVEIIKGKWFDD